MATCNGEQAGGEAAVASIKDAKARAKAAQNARMEVAAVAIKTEQNEADAAGAVTKAAIARISMGKASNGAVTVNNNMDRTIARAQVGYPLINRNPKMTHPRHVPMWTGVNDPSNSLYGVGVTRSPPRHLREAGLSRSPPHPRDQDWSDFKRIPVSPPPHLKRRQPTSHLDLQRK